MLQHALSYADLGWHVFPLQPGSKKPLGAWKDEATTDADQIKLAWLRTARAGIGVACGPSGLVVVDLDPGKGGVTAWKQLCQENDVLLAPSVMQLTGGGGAHLFYSSPPDVVIHNSVSRLGPGIDVRGEGGYVVVPPSMHPSGGQYRWKNGRDPFTHELTELPHAIISLLKVSKDRAPEVQGLIPEGERDTMLTSLAGTMRRRGLDEEAILAAISVINENRCVPPLGEDQVAKIAQSVCNYPPIAEMHLTDLGNARLLVGQHGKVLRYCQPWQHWLVWDGTRWKEDNTEQVMVMAKGVVPILYNKLSGLADKKDRQALLNHARRTESKYALTCMVDLARSEPQVAVPPDVFDQDEWALNVANGTIDLRTGELRPHRMEDMHTKLAPVIYDEEAECPNWMRFLGQITGEDQELVTYLQKVLGYALTGSTREQAFFILYGTGANGKSTCLEAVSGILGDYAQQVPSATLIVRREGSGDSPRGDLARLKGVRLATAIETEAGTRLAEALVKQMTGGDRITARFPFGRHFEYTPTHKVFLATNHEPEIRGTDHAIWRRIHKIPFTVTIPEEDQVPDYGQIYLRQEWPGILRWMVEGCLAWQGDGRLARPRIVEDATQTYKSEMSPLHDFLSECTVEGEFDCKVSDLWEAYNAWCIEYYARPVRRRLFGQSLLDKGYVRSRRRDGTWYQGLKLETSHGATER